MWVNVKYIKVSEKQFRKLDKAKVDRHRMDFEEVNPVMPIDVVKIDKDEYCISGNGRHRYYGALLAGVSIIEINVLN